MNVTAARTANPVVPQHSPWHSPVPYLFGGLAAMLGLIAFALVILACSYWKLSGYLENGNEGGERDLEAGGGEGGDNNEKQRQGVVFEEKFLVIMAGEVKPTFLATPMSSRSSSFGDTKSCSCGEKSEKSTENCTAETVKQSDQEQSSRLETTTTQESISDQTH
ncbi:conserved hypothetical protein [Ricinus communis]|uniref:Uncharacterized protein n=1 Tax=Ricinus communis TaxID=3988 RepID=B9T0I1_RICCO|nr:conserved hypothetical protein [Ricinus communis]|eukprot:XP_002531750.1 protein GLUTAMINE DUMPER 2 [Ricinus communis]